MTQDLTAPIDRVLVSRHDAFSRAYELYQDEQTPQDLSGYTFFGELRGPQLFGQLLSVDRLNAYTLGISLSTAQMGALVPGAYTVLVIGERETSVGVERKVVVQLQMQVSL